MAFNSIDFGGPKQGRNMTRLARDLLRVGRPISIDPIEEQNTELFSGITEIGTPFSPIDTGEDISAVFGGKKRGLFRNPRLGRLPIGGRIDAPL